MPSADPQSSPYTVAVLGGGIAGLSLAIGLQRHGVPFHLYESAPAFAEVGAGVGFGPNSVHAMQLLDPRVRERYHVLATQNRDRKGTWLEVRMGCERRSGTHCNGNDARSNGIIKGNVDGEEKATGIQVGDKIAEMNTTLDGKPFGQSSVHRAAFLDELVALIPKENVSFNHRVVAIDDLGAEGVRIHFEHGETARADAAVGCDGIKSRVRRIVLGEDNPAAHPSFTGKYAYRGLIPMDKAVALLGDGLARNSVIYPGYHGHVITMPIEHGATMNVVAFRTKADGKWADERWVLPTEKADMRAEFQDFGPSVRDILSLMQTPDLWALFDYPPAETYFRGRVCLLGDAAHASTPHQGAGAGMAIEDAFVLSNLLGEVSHPNQLENAFQAFDQIRRPRTQKLVTTSREAGELWDLEAAGIGDDMEKFRANLHVRMDWIWDIDLEAHLREAKSLLTAERQQK
ncbi:MAG: hypothetical protein Q9195_000212 [Heterodermia aff. obscurata]